MPLRTGFQTFVNNELPDGVPGDFADVNPRASIDAGPGAFVAGIGGVTVGVFAWFDLVSGIATSYFRPNCVLGFVHRENNGLITVFLGIATMQVVPGNMVTGMSQGGYKGVFLGGANVGQKVYADPLTGALTAAAAAGGVTGLNTAGATVAAGGILTTTDADQTGSALAANQIVTGGTLPEGTYIASANGTGSGTHLWILANLNGTAIPVNATPFTLTNTGKQESNFKVSSPVAVNAVATGSSIDANGVLTVGTVTGGVFGAGQFLTDLSALIPVSANAQILYQLPGGTPGGAGTYQTNYNAVVASTTITGAQGQLGSFTTWQ